MRDQLIYMGIAIEDTAKGTTWKIAKEPFARNNNKDFQRIAYAHASKAAALPSLIESSR